MDIAQLVGLDSNRAQPPPLEEIATRVKHVLDSHSGSTVVAQQQVDDAAVGLPYADVASLEALSSSPPGPSWFDVSPGRFLSSDRLFVRWAATQAYVRWADERELQWWLTVALSLPPQRQAALERAKARRARLREEITALLDQSETGWSLEDRPILERLRTAPSFRTTLVAESTGRLELVIEACDIQFQIPAIVLSSPIRRRSSVHHRPDAPAFIEFRELSTRRELHPMFPEALASRAGLVLSRLGAGWPR